MIEESILAESIGVGANLSRLNGGVWQCSKEAALSVGLFQPVGWGQMGRSLPVDLDGGWLGSLGLSYLSVSSGIDRASRRNCRLDDCISYGRCGNSQTCLRERRAYAEQTGKSDEERECKARA